ncbi:MAG: hypothetical protein M5U19_13655 [Microthrixaceae bacterium]|nr:hypothetical protein [Microthrixaceae bacterium]
MAVVAFGMCASVSIVAPDVGATGLTDDASPADAAAVAQPEAEAAESTTPMVDVADRTDSQGVGTSAALLLGANVVMLAVGAGLLWRRCSERQPARQL